MLRHVVPDSVRNALDHSRPKLHVFLLILTSWTPGLIVTPFSVRRNSKPESTQCSDRKSTLPTNDSPTEKVNSALVFPVPSVFPSSPPSALSETPGDLQDPSLPPPHLSYGSVRLPAPNKRTFATSTTEEYPPNPFSRLRERLPEPTNEEAPEILTRLVREDEEDPLSASDLSSDTYETSFKFLVPTNSVIKQITIHLKQRKWTVPNFRYAVKQFTPLDASFFLSIVQHDTFFFRFWAAMWCKCFAEKYWLVIQCSCMCSVASPLGENFTNAIQRIGHLTAYVCTPFVPQCEKKGFAIELPEGRKSRKIH